MSWFKRKKASLESIQPERIASYERWKAAHPNHPFWRYYEQMEMDRVAKGNPPNFLKKEPSDPGPEHILAAMMKLGLQPEHFCVDYGCGGLLVGRLLIEYLHPDHYWGVDVSQHFLDIGHAYLQGDSLQEKNPRLTVLDEQILSDIRQSTPDALICTGVVLHVPPEELDGFIKNLSSLMAPRTTLYLRTKTSKELFRASWQTWSYPLDQLSSLIASSGLTVAETLFDYTPERHLKRGVKNTWLKIVKAS